jgi:Family of unknown function (DUF6282)
MSSVRALPSVDGKGIVDLHVHAGPELLRRRYDPMTLAAEARREGIGIVIKNHFNATTSWAMMARQSDNQVPIVGSVTLNYPLGGIDSHGIRAAISGLKKNPSSNDPEPERFVVWMPTIQAEAHLAHFGRHDIPLAWGVSERYCQEFGVGQGLSIFDPDRKLAQGTQRVIDSVNENDLILATGHLNRTECRALIDAAHSAGVQRLVVTHPLWDVTEFEPEELSHLWQQFGAYAELCYVNLDLCGIDHCTLAQYIDVIRAVGPEGVVLTSDLGQPHMPSMADGFRHFLQLLEAEGVSETDVTQMAVINPRRLLFAPREELEKRTRPDVVFASF